MNFQRILVKTQVVYEQPVVLDETGKSIGETVDDILKNHKRVHGFCNKIVVDLDPRDEVPRCE